MRCFVSWSGGKDSCLALWRAQRGGADIACLLTTYSPRTGRTMGHGLPIELVRTQAEGLGLELVAVETEWGDYEENFGRALRGLSARGVEAGVFGDLDIAEHRAWVERVAAQADLKAHLPLWGGDQVSLLREFVAAGFKAMIVAARSEIGLQWLGRPLDARCVADLERELGGGGLSPSGENGEYHTVVLDGPPFSRPLEVTEATAVLRGRDWVLDIRQFGLSGALSARGDGANETENAFHVPPRQENGLKM